MIFIFVLHINNIEVKKCLRKYPRKFLQYLNDHYAMNYTTLTIVNSFFFYKQLVIPNMLHLTVDVFMLLLPDLNLHCVMKEDRLFFSLTAVTLSFFDL